MSDHDGTTACRLSSARHFIASTDPAHRDRGTPTTCTAPRASSKTRLSGGTPPVEGAPAPGMAAVQPVSVRSGRSIQNMSTNDERDRVAQPDAPVPGPPAGWYQDPTGHGQRYWDGRSWTPHIAPFPPPPSRGRVGGGQPLPLFLGIWATARLLGPMVGLLLFLILLPIGALVLFAMLRLVT